MDWLTEQFRTRSKGLGDFHLRAALQWPAALLGNVGVGRFREQKALKSIQAVHTTITIADPGALLGNMCRETQIGGADTISELNTLLEILDIEKPFFDITRCENDLLERIKQYLKGTPVESKYTYDKESLQEGLLYVLAITSGRDPPKGLSRVKQKTDHAELRVQSVVFELWGDLIWVSSPYKFQDKTIQGIITLDMYRNITDKYTERENVIIGTVLGSYVTPAVYPTKAYLEEILTCFDRGLRSHGNNFYPVIKTFESLVNGVIIAHNEGIYFDPLSYLEETIHGLALELRIYAEQMVRILQRPPFNPHHLAQIGGLFRLWGHPVVDSREGVRKVREVGTKFKSPNHLVPELAGRKFKEIFFTQYYAAHKTYPPNRIIGAAPPEPAENNDRLPGGNKKENIYLHECLETMGVLNTKSTRYSLYDWDSVEVLPTFPFPKTFNLSMIIADKAVSPNRQEWRDISEGRETQMNPHIRRGPLKAIKDGVVNCESLLRRINEKYPGLSKKHLIIGLYPKEREENPKPRMFSLMSFDVRAYSVVTEKMIADHIVKYIPGVTMTKSMLDLQKEMIISTKSQEIKRDTTSITFCLNIDFEKWNLNFRRWMTSEVFGVMGDLFGLHEIFSRTYDIFENSIIYLADGSYTLKLDESLNLVPGQDENCAYEGHLGGFEGLRQKGWTVFTAVVLALVCDELGVKTHLMGQGDNQVLMITIFSNWAIHTGSIRSPEAVAEVRSTLIKVKNRIVEIFGQLQLPIKPLETWISEELFAYGKTPIYRGVPLAVSLKRLARVFPFSNEDLMTLSNAMGAISANAQAAAMCDVNPAVSYTVAKWQQLNCARLFLIYHPLIGGPPKEKGERWGLNMRLASGRKVEEVSRETINQDTLILAIVTIPRSLGGFNTLSWPEMIMRGFSDPPSRDMCWMFSLIQSSNGVLKEILINWVSPIFCPEVHPQHLVQDPTSLNLLTPPNSSAVIKKMIDKSIMGLPTDSEFSKWFKELLEISNDKEVVNLCERLLETDTLNPRFLHDIVGATLYGYCTSIAGKVDKTVTLSRITMGSEDVVGALIKGEKRFILYFGWRCLNDSGMRPNTKCPNKWVRTIRDLSWQKKIVAVSVPYPGHYLSEDKNQTDRPDSFISCYVDDPPLMDSSKLFTSLGNALPYLGSVTKEKLETRGVRAVFGTEPLVSRPLSLVRTIGWFIDHDSNFADLIGKLLAAVTNLPLDDVLYIPEMVSGSMSHRYLDLATQHGSLWMPLFGSATFLHLSTADFVQYAKGTDNVTVHFQCLLGLIQFAVLNEVMGPNQGRRVRTFFRTCKRCITAVNDEIEDLPMPIPRQLVPSKKLNPYLYVSKNQVELLHKHRLTIINRIPVIGKEDISYSPNLANEILEDLFALRVANRVFFSQAEKGAQWDLQSVDRIVYLRMDFLSLIQKIAGLMFILEAQTLKDKMTLPLWNRLKRKVLRRIRQSDTSNFVHLGGFFCWADSLDSLQQLEWVMMPSSYPMDAGSVSLSGKISLINYIRLDDSVIKSASGVLPDFSLVDISLLAKSYLMLRKQESRWKCQECYAEGMKARWSDQVNNNEILNLRCDSNHHIISTKDICHLQRTIIGENSLINLATPIAKKTETKTKKPVVTTTPQPRSSIILVSGATVRANTGVQGKMPRLPNIESPYQVEELHKPYRIPTNALYRTLDLWDSCLWRVNLVSTGAILVIGDGFGYSSLMTKLLCPQREVVSWTYIDPSSALAHSLTLSKPPTHYRCNLPIDNSPSINCISNVFHPKFEEEFQEVVKSKRITMILSDIETVYVPGEKSLHILIPMCWRARIIGGAIKLETKSDDIQKVVEEVSTYYLEWSIRAVPSICPELGTVFLYFRGPVETPSPVYLDQRCCQEIVNKFYDYQMERLMRLRGDHFRRWAVLSSLAPGVGWDTHLDTMLSVWFGSSFLDGYDQADLTKFYYSVKTSYHPKWVIDETGNQAHYLYESREENLFKCLITVCLSMVEDPQEIIREFIIPSGWEIQWRSAGISKAPSSMHQWAPVLVRVDKSRFWTRNKQEIFKMLAPLRKVRGAEICPFLRPAKEIRFGYIPRKERNLPRSLTLPISRVAALTFPSLENLS